MKQYIVLLDRATLRGELRIPAFNHVWVEHPNTPVGACIDHLWRATIGVTHQTHISPPDIDGCAKLRLLIVTGPDAGVVDQETCRARAIQVLHLPQGNRTDQAWADALMDAIEAFAGQHKAD